MSWRLGSVRAVVVVVLCLLAPSGYGGQDRVPMLRPVLAKPWTGDFDGMVKRRVIRALVVYSKPFYFLD